MSPDIPDRLYFKIGEVARLIGVKASVLRYWETEFSFLKPDKSSSGQRLYTKKNVELIQEVKRLLYAEKYTIEGVKKKLTSSGKLSINYSSLQESKQDYLGLLKEIKEDLVSLRCQIP